MSIMVGLMIGSCDLFDMLVCISGSAEWKESERERHRTLSKCLAR